MSSLLASAPRHRLESLLGYEEKLLADLGGESRLSALTSGLGPALDKVRTALGREAVHQGWVRHLHHNQRTAKGDEPAGRVGSFERDLRRLRIGEGEEALTGELLPYADKIHAAHKEAESARQRITKAGELERQLDALALEQNAANADVLRLEGMRDRLTAELDAARERRRFGHKHQRTLIQENEKHLAKALSGQNELAEQPP